MPKETRDVLIVPQAMSVHQVHLHVLFVQLERIVPTKLKMLQVFQIVQLVHSALKETQYVPIVLQDTSVDQDHPHAPFVQLEKIAPTKLKMLEVFQTVMQVHIALKEIAAALHVLQVP